MKYQNVIHSHRLGIPWRRDPNGVHSDGCSELYRPLDDGKLRLPSGREFESIQEASAEADGHIEIRVRRRQRRQHGSYVQEREELAQPLSVQYAWSTVGDRSIETTESIIMNF